MAVIGAREIQPVNILGQYVQGLEAARAATRQRRADEVAMLEAQRAAELRNFLSATPDLMTPEAQNQLLRFGKPGAEMAASFADIAGKRATARKTDLEIAAKGVEMVAREAGGFLANPSALNKATLAPWVQSAVQRGILQPEDIAKFDALPDDPVKLAGALEQLRTQGVSLADQLRYSRVTPGEQLTADVAVRGQDVSAVTARRGQDITVRGQDISAETARRGQDITMRGQDITATIQSPEYQGLVTAARERAKSDIKFGDEFNAAQQTANRTLSLLDQIVGDTQVINGKLVVKSGEREPMKGFRGAVGASLIPGQRFVPGTAARDFTAAHDQAVGAAFMQAFATLKGGGQITEREGEKATAALTRMNLAQSEVEYVRAAREFQKEVKDVLELAKTRYNKLRPEQATAEAGSRQTSAGTNYQVLED